MERAWGLSLEEGLWVQRLTRPLDWSRVALLPWVGMPGNLAGTHDPCQQSPGQNPGDVQGCAQRAPQSSSGGSTLLTPPPSRPGLQAASWRPVVSTDSPRRFSTTGCGPVAPGGAPRTLILSPPRPGPALPARSPEAQTLASPPRWRALPRLPCASCHRSGRAQGAAVGLWVPGSHPLPSLSGRPYLLMVNHYPPHLPPESDSAFRSTGLRSP